MKLSFHGADRGVTGSCHLVECAGKNVLIDCGPYQGAHELETDNVASFGFDAPTIDYVLLTHAHLDHCGRLPLVVKRGFRGEIITTPATRELTRRQPLIAIKLRRRRMRIMSIIEATCRPYGVCIVGSMRWSRIQWVR